MFIRTVASFVPNTLATVRSISTSRIHPLTHLAHRRFCTTPEKHSNSSSRIEKNTKCISQLQEQMKTLAHQVGAIQLTPKQPAQWELEASTQKMLKMLDVKFGDLEENVKNHKKEVCQRQEKTEKEFAKALRGLTASLTCFEENMNQKFADSEKNMHQQLANSEENMNQKFADSEKNMHQQLANSEKNMNQKFADSEKNMHQQLANSEKNMNQKFADSEKNRKQQFADSEKNMNQKLADSEKNRKQQFADFAEVRELRFNDLKMVIKAHASNIEAHATGIQAHATGTNRLLTLIVAIAGIILAHNLWPEGMFPNTVSQLSEIKPPEE